MARNEAKRLASMQQKLTQLIQDYPASRPFGGEVLPSVFMERSDISLRVASYVERIQGIGDKFITFRHSSKKYPGDFPEVLGVDTQDRLDLGIHTDARTREQLEQMDKEKTNPREIKMLQSIYFFDESGNYGKVISLPRSLPDSRSDIGNPGVVQKYVVADMTAGDFELAGAALTMLTKRLQPPPTNPQ